MSCVLWPEDIRISGFFYGWLSPLLCVAGVIDLSSRADAEDALRNAIKLEHLARAAQFCGSDPLILGRCTFQPEDPSHPALEFLDRHIAEFNLVSYRRPNLAKLEIHTLNSSIPIDKEVSLPLRAFAAAHVAHDFTRPSHRGRGVFDSLVIRQMNYGQLFEQKIRNTSPKALLPLRSGAKHVGSAFARLGSRGSRQTSFSDIFPSVYKLYTVLQENSALCQQTSMRVRQLVSLPHSVPIKTYDDGLVSVDASAQYVAFYNCVWLILNDIIIGWAVGSFIRENASPIASLLNYWLRRFLLDDLQTALLWLNSWPAGLKLNTESSRFLCYWLLEVIVLWNRLLALYILPYLEPIVYMTGCLGLCGMTITVSIIADLLALLTLHTHICYLVLRLVYGQQLQITGSLWNLFRGKRYNALRKRIDSWSYDVDQLLFGTILFTLVAFLFPTTVTYYALFALIRLVVMLAYAISDLLLAVINEFPLFALLLRVKDPYRLPGGVVYVLNGNRRMHHLKSETTTVGSIFAHYGNFWSAFSAHYHPGTLARQFVTSKRLNHINSNT